MKQLLTALATIAVLAQAAYAQIIRPVVTHRPTAYTSLSVGWLSQQTICDPASQACWQFGAAPQYRVTLELPMGAGSSFGVSYATAKLPLIWRDTPPNTANCSQCDADGEVHQLLGLLHLGGDRAFSQLIDLSAGATQFANFKATDGTPLGAGKPVTDFSFAVAFGAGYSMTRSLQLTLQQEYGLVIHARVDNSTNRSAQQQTLRFGVRWALD